MNTKFDGYCFSRSRVMIGGMYVTDGHTDRQIDRHITTCVCAHLIFIIRVV